MSMNSSRGFVLLVMAFATRNPSSNRRRHNQRCLDMERKQGDQENPEVASMVPFLPPFGLEEDSCHILCQVR